MTNMIDTVEIPADKLFDLLPCDHEKEATLVKVETGERVEAGEWVIIKSEFEVRCGECPERVRFSLTDV